MSNYTHKRITIYPIIVYNNLGWIILIFFCEDKLRKCLLMFLFFYFNF